MASPRRIRVAYCLDSFTIGGTELNAVRTAEALDPDRIELCVIHLQTHGPLRSRYERLGVRMEHFPLANLYSPRTAVQGIHLARLLRRWNVDVVHSHDIYCNIFAVPWARIFSRCSIIASRRWWWAEVPRPKLETVNRWSSLFAHRVLANSSGVADLLVREERVPREKIVEIPNFLAETAFSIVDEAARVAQRRAWGLPDGAFAVGIVARLSPVKNHALLLKAAAQLDARFHVVLIGDGPSRAGLEELARQLRIESRVHFAGEVSPQNLHQFFDVSVLCSLSEGFPNSLIEAMAVARPVVATPVGGVTDAVAHGVTGIVVPVDDPAPLVDALRMLETDSLLRTRLGEAGREAVRAKFRQEIIIEKLSALYEMLADRGPAAILRRADE